MMTPLQTNAVGVQKYETGKEKLNSLKSTHKVDRKLSDNKSSKSLKITHS